MTINELVEVLTELYNNGVYDNEVAHDRADAALIEYINDERVTKAYDKLVKWYA